MRQFLKNINTRQNQPFPFRESATQNAVLTLLVSAFVAFFLLFFQPFGIDNFEHTYKTAIILGYGLVTAFSMILVYFVFPKIFKSYFNDEKWTAKREMFVYLSLILLITVFNFLYGYTVCFECRPFRGGFWNAVYLSVSSTLAVSIFPTIAVILLVQNQLTKKHLEKAEFINRQLLQKLEPATQSSNSVEFKLSQTQKLRIETDDLVCIQADDNYVQVYFLKEHKIQKEMIRYSLKKIESEILNNDVIVRCHKSYIVNLSKIKKISGNAQGYKLHTEELDFEIPVSRNLSKAILEKISN